MNDDRKHMVKARAEVLSLEDQAIRDLNEEGKARVLAEHVRGQYRLKMVQWAVGAPSMAVAVIAAIYLGGVMSWVVAIAIACSACAAFAAYQQAQGGETFWKDDDDNDDDDE